MLDLASISAGVTALTSALGTALADHGIADSVYGNTAMELVKIAYAQTTKGVGCLRDHVKRLDPRHNHILYRTMLVAYWQAIGQTANQHSKDPRFRVASLGALIDSASDLRDLAKECDLRIANAKSDPPETLGVGAWKSAVENAYLDLNALVAQPLVSAGPAREGPALEAWNALRRDFPKAAKTAGFEDYFFNHWLDYFTVNFQFAATRDETVRTLLTLHLFSEIPAGSSNSELDPNSILVAFTQVGDDLRHRLDNMHADLGDRIDASTQTILGAIREPRTELPPPKEPMHYRQLAFGRLAPGIALGVVLMLGGVTLAVNRMLDLDSRRLGYVAGFWEEPSNDGRAMQGQARVWVMAKGVKFADVRLMMAIETRTGQVQQQELPQWPLPDQVGMDQTIAIQFESNVSRLTTCLIVPNNGLGLNAPYRVTQRFVVPLRGNEGGAALAQTAERHVSREDGSPCGSARGE